MKRTIDRIAFAVIALMLVACGGASSDEAAAEANTGASQASGTTDTSASQSSDFDRASFVLCDALEPHREELASIVGFEQDAERSLSVMRSECVVRGHDFEFARVSILPAMIPSIALHAQGFDGEASAAAELGEDAMFIADGNQPHLVFAMGGLFIDVNAESVDVPSRETMVELALRVREILAEANS